ncbi:hypothetical protein HK098_002140 [Nowakowskiella sp. JEL0407]|nr:hypothetical protein HK098_002140 [Nowakowskiella sp. JEL0407]
MEDQLEAIRQDFEDLKEIHNTCGYSVNECATSVIDELNLKLFSGSFDCQKYADHPVLLELWLAYIDAKRTVGEPREKIEEMYKNLVTLGIGTKHAEFYLSWSAFEERFGSYDKAMNILFEGLGCAKSAEKLRSKIVSFSEYPNVNKHKQSNPKKIPQSDSKSTNNQQHGSLQRETYPDNMDPSEPQYSESDTSNSFGSIDTTVPIAEHAKNRENRADVSTSVTAVASSSKSFRFSCLTILKDLN